MSDEDDEADDGSKGPIELHFPLLIGPSGADRKIACLRNYSP